jgi:hypothetical protein
MTTINAHWILQLLSANLAFILNGMFLQLFLVLELLLIIGVINAFPSFPLLILKVLLELPTSFVGRTVMQIQAAVTKNAIPTIMPVFA